MKNVVATLMVLGSAVALNACSTAGSSDRDETLTQAPYTEERTVGTAPGREPVRSAEPVFERRQVK